MLSLSTSSCPLPAGCVIDAGHSKPDRARPLPGWETDLSAEACHPPVALHCLGTGSDRGLAGCVLCSCKPASFLPHPRPLCPSPSPTLSAPGPLHCYFSLSTVVAHLLRLRNTSLLCTCYCSLSQEPPQNQIKSPLGVPTILWASSKLPSSLCIVTLHPSVQLPHFTDMETEAQKGKVTCWRRSRAGAQPRAFHHPTCSLCYFPFLGTRAHRGPDVVSN